ncbi:MAG: LysR family transcriptional regulator [Adlercreutzia mucosicola]|nr:LysR family transcriptional regulator [Adlercreutzia mucosicola]
MDIQQLEYVVYAVRLESHTRAAEALYVQPQTISKAVSNTETRCGRKLFVREGRNVRATDFGRQYADLAEQVTRAYAALENLEQPPVNLALLADTLSLAVATTAYRGDICPPDAIPAFLERPPPMFR